MLSKWEWIAKACEYEGLYGSAVIAKQLEHILKEIYGCTITERWKNDYGLLKSFSLDGIYRIQSSGPYCIGCEDSNYSCGRCLLNSKHVGCWNRRSLYQRFLKVLEWEVYHRSIDIEMPC